ncbi:hypothetical protein ACQP3C_28885, partial [Escherichia coli]
CKGTIVDIAFSLFLNRKRGRPWWHMPLILALGSREQRQTDLYEFKARVICSDLVTKQQQNHQS